MSYVEEICALVGWRPLVLVGALVMVFDEQERILMLHRTDEEAWGIYGTGRNH